MPLILPDGFQNTRFRWTCDGLPDEMGFSIATVAPVDDDPVQLASDMYDAIVASLMVLNTNMSTEWSFQGVTSTIMTSSGPLVGQADAVVNGTASGGSIPANSAVLVRKNTALGGRANRGRFYWPGVAVGDASVTASGFIDSAAVNALQDIVDDLFSAITASVGQPFLLHSTSVPTPTIVTSFTVQNQIATQRTRMR